jgi:hypothetical protein
MGHQNGIETQFSALYCCCVKINASWFVCPDFAFAGVTPMLFAAC